MCTFTEFCEWLEPLAQRAVRDHMAALQPHNRTREFARITMSWEMGLQIPNRYHDAVAATVTMIANDVKDPEMNSLYPRVNARKRWMMTFVDNNVSREFPLLTGVNLGQKDQRLIPTWSLCRWLEEHDMIDLQLDQLLTGE